MSAELDRIIAFADPLCFVRAALMEVVKVYWLRLLVSYGLFVLVILVVIIMVTDLSH